MMKILCKLNIHKWKYEKKDNIDMKPFRESIYDLFRAVGYSATCLRCGKKQNFTPHGWMDV